MKQALEEILGYPEEEAINKFNRNKRRVSSKYLKNNYAIKRLQSYKA